jgi:RimJ/RimL family protein N-acetyltransferase
MINYNVGNCQNLMGRRIAKWFESQSGYTVNSPYSCIGINEGKELIGVLIFVDYTGSNIELHAFLHPGCITRKLIKYVARYVFVELGCNVLRAKPHHKNEIVIDLLGRLGFEYEATLERYYSDTDHAVVFKLKKPTPKNPI